MNTEPKHTPGPWRIRPDALGTMKGNKIVGNDGSVICTITREKEKCHDTVSLDAHLIAAAPETARQRDLLLKILREGADIVSGLEAECDNAGVGDLAEIRDWWREADEAIAACGGAS